MSQAPVSALQQDHVSRQNNAQARRHSADARGNDAARSFADMLRASESPENDLSSALLQPDNGAQKDTKDTPADPAAWLALAQVAQTEASDTATDADALLSSGAARTDDVEWSAQDSADEWAMDDTSTESALQDPEGSDLATDPGSDPAAGRELPGSRRASSRALASGAVSQAPGVAQSHASAALLNAGPAAAALTAAAAPAQGALAQAGAVAQGLMQGVFRAPAGTGQPGGNPEPGAQALEGLTATGPDAQGAMGTTAVRAAAGGAPSSGGDTGMGADMAGDTTATEPTDEAASPTEWADRWQQAMDDVGQQVTYWLGKGVRQAQIQVRAGLDRPIDVALSVENGQAALRFLTDSASARAAIESGAADVLRDLLARDGIGLAGLSVGSQASSHGGEASGAPQGRALRGASASLGAVAADGALAMAPAQRSTRALDVYA